METSFCDHFDNLTLECHRCFKNAPNWMKFGLECGNTSFSKASSFHQNTYRDGVKIRESLTVFSRGRRRRRSSIEAAEAKQGQLPNAADPTIFEILARFLVSIENIY